MHGKGRLELADGSVFEGAYVDGCRHGYGEFKWADGEQYCGEYARDVKHGKGVYTWSDGRRYEGDFDNDKRRGNGKFFWANGDWFEGVYHNDMRSGHGTMFYADNTVDNGRLIFVNCIVLIRLCARIVPTVALIVGIWAGSKLMKIVPYCWPSGEIAAAGRLTMVLSVVFFIVIFIAIISDIIEIGFDDYARQDNYYIPRMLLLLLSLYCYYY